MKVLSLIYGFLLEGSMYKILIAEDEWITRNALMETVDWAKVGCEVVAGAKDGYEALELIEQFSPDIVISDIKMDGMDGLELCTNINKLFSGIKVIFITGYSEFDYAQNAIKGVPRTSKSAYNYAFDLKIRKYLTSDPLTRELFAKILLEMDSQESITKNYYSEACKQGLIDQTLQLKLKSKDVLAFPEVYYAASQFIEKKTGKTLK